MFWFYSYSVWTLHRYLRISSQWCLFSYSSGMYYCIFLMKRAWYMELVIVCQHLPCTPGDDCLITVEGGWYRSRGALMKACVVKCVRLKKENRTTAGFLRDLLCCYQIPCHCSAAAVYEMAVINLSVIYLLLLPQQSLSFFFRSPAQDSHDILGRAEKMKMVIIVLFIKYIIFIS